MVVVVAMVVDKRVAVVVAVVVLVVAVRVINVDVAVVGAIDEVSSLVLRVLLGPDQSSRKTNTTTTDTKILSMHHRRARTTD